MSLDVYFTKMMPTEVFSRNITHNLGEMSRQVVLKNGKTLYDVLWRADEHGFKTGGDIADLLLEGYNILCKNPTKFKEFNPSNGWGNYEGLCNFVHDYYKGCLEFADLEFRISR
jgi:hypothetical protein